MQTTDKLYQETLIRVGRPAMAGVDSLLEQGHTGIAEKHTVQKLIRYVQELESQLGIDVEVMKQQNLHGKILVRDAGQQYYL